MLDLETVIELIKDEWEVSKVGPTTFMWLINDIFMVPYASEWDFPRK
jgi:hypothetical protein